MARERSIHSFRFTYLFAKQLLHVGDRQTQISAAESHHDGPRFLEVKVIANGKSKVEIIREGVFASVRELPLRLQCVVASAMLQRKRFDLFLQRKLCSSACALRLLFDLLLHESLVNGRSLYADMARARFVLFVLSPYSPVMFRCLSVSSRAMSLLS